MAATDAELVAAARAVEAAQAEYDRLAKLIDAAWQLKSDLEATARLARGKLDAARAALAELIARGAAG